MNTIIFPALLMNINYHTVALLSKLRGLCDGGTHFFSCNIGGLVWCDDGLTGRRDGMIHERKKHETKTD